MSVVNKMLQDLEARQSDPNNTTADYQPPIKKQSKLLVYGLLILAILAVAYALTDIDELLGDTANTGVKSTASLPKKMHVIPAVVEPVDVAVDNPELVSSNQSSEDQIEVSSSAPIEANVFVAEESLAESVSQLTLGNNREQKSPTSIADVKPEATSQPSFSMSGSSKENRTASLKQRIAEAINNNDSAQAQQLLNQLLTKQPTNIKARKKLASLYFAQGKFVQTKLLLQQGLDLHSEQADLRLMLARLFSAQKDKAEAMTILENYQPDITNQTEYLAYRAALAQQLNRTALAKKDYQKLSVIDGQNAKWWLGLGIAHDQLGNSNDALQAYRYADSLRQLEGSVNDFVIQRISVLAGSQ